jgi:DNA-binding NarL/FixJ family response regulator
LSLGAQRRNFGERRAFSNLEPQAAKFDSVASWRQNVINLEQIKITRRDQQVLKLLVQGCSNKDIAAELKISPRTVKQHLRTLFLRAGIKHGRKRVILATAIFEKEQMNYVATRAVDLPGDQSRNAGLAGAD